VSSQISAEQDREELLRTFRGLDVNGDGSLTREELRAGYLKVCGLNQEEAEQQVENIFRMVDTNHSGVIDFSEFIVAAAEEYKNLSAKKIKQAFNIFDLDGNGYIDKVELINVLGAVEIDEKEWKELIKDIDADHDGRVGI
jgi:calcium-dependent protein kinase